MTPPPGAGTTPSTVPALCRTFLTVALFGILLVLSPGWSASEGSRVQSLIASRAVAGAYSPDQIRRAYDFLPLHARGVTGAGETVALIELDQYVAADVGLFDSTYGLSTPVVTDYYVDGPGYLARRGAETNLDVEWLHALAPGAALQIYYVNSIGPLSEVWRSMARAMSMAAQNGATVVSISLGTCRPGFGLTVTRSALAELVRRKISVFVSSGDYGDRPGPKSQCGSKIGVAYPTGDPSVVSVGGTSLRLKPDNTISSETAWKLSGGGRFQKLQRARWQLAPSMPKDGFRWVPDVAFLGDPHMGVRFVENGRWRIAAGTSLGAPAWAAIWALVLQDAANAGKSPDVAQQAIYQIGNSARYSNAFHDITTGSNGRYHAGVGWDPVTGWGTPDVAALADAVVAESPAR